MNCKERIYKCSKISKLTKKKSGPQIVFRLFFSRRLTKFLTKKTFAKLKSRLSVVTSFPFCFRFSFFSISVFADADACDASETSFSVEAHSPVWCEHLKSKKHRWWTFESRKTIDSVPNKTLQSRDNRKPLEWNVPADDVVVVVVVATARARNATGKLSRVVLTQVVRLDFVRPNYTSRLCLMSLFSFLQQKKRSILWSNLHPSSR